jgi:proteasome lid subunit RPN8/RPN11
MSAAAYTGGAHSEPVEVRLEAEAEAALRQFAAAAYPNEGCGVLIGVIHADVERIHVVEATSGRNLRTDRPDDRYELDPSDIVAAERSARTRSLDIVGFWHSHPDHPAKPSDFDTDRAWPDYAYLIVSTTAAGPRDVRAWVIDERRGLFAAAPLSAAGT